MFDFSIGEIVTIGTVALVVLGPERLPKVARTVGQWVGKAQRYVNDVKADIQREADMLELKKLQEQMTESARELESSVKQSLATIEGEIKPALAEAEAALSDATAAAHTPAVDKLHEGLTPAYDDYAAASGSDYLTTQGEFVKRPPSLEDLASQVERLQASLARSAGSRRAGGARLRATESGALRLRSMRRHRNGR
ncbi:hypothetical protein BH10PSE17_BH10PSE17_30590 [soil metagenome]